MTKLAPVVSAALILGCGRQAPKRTTITMPDPSPLSIVLAPGDGLDSRSLTITGGHLLLQGCARGTGASLFLGEDTDLAGLDTTLLGGNWCGFTVSLGDTATLKAITHSGDWLQAPVGGTDIALGNEDGVSVSGQSFILELGGIGWLDAATLGMGDSGSRTLTETDAELALITTALKEGSALYEDLDGNGILGSDERSEVRAAYMPPSPVDTGQPDTGSPDTGETDTGDSDTGN